MKKIVCVGMILISSFLSGCFYSAAVGVADVAIIERTKQKHAFIHAMEDGYAQYQQDWEGSDCPRNEYEVSPKIVEFAKSRPPYGLDAAIKMLMEIYNDTTQTDQVRSHALYHVAVAYMRRRESNYEIAEEYLETIRDNFPGTHDCVVARLLQEIEERKAFQGNFEDQEAG
ncbi:hypothetical protein BTA51_20900 [Hahella sp. CCB-MM4]|uniref:hypothetical protein n=1 Tax=Hahella sp. (strain CCB-MM4) TaxID=1926491 RepID=UPI000B9B010F|nr:hypothetical protein [Hahella sp. CCB-MM4]OZG71398.1 hypothetical protein BTA51_20900 [Hahella sp. CCB-MM4]